jgi:hypothetical protein
MSKPMARSRKIDTVVHQNARFAKNLWPEDMAPAQLSALRSLTLESGLSLALGEILWLNRGWYVTSGGLLRLAKEKHCHGIQTQAISKLCDRMTSRWVFRATVYKTPRSRGFVGYGDADPSNVSPLVRGAEMRVAETRAVNRALRKAYGIGLCSVEELGYLTSRPEPPANPGNPQSHSNGNHSGNGHSRLRDRLCLLIREYRLDPSLVKRYAADFCGTQELREASRDLVESFITHLAEWAAKDHAGLVCKLNGYAQPEQQEVQS